MCRVILHIDETNAEAPRIVLTANQHDLILSETEADRLFHEMIWARDTLRNHRLDAAKYKRVTEVV
jgi:hypothetical protein